MSRRSGSYPKELRDRAVRMVAEVRSEHASAWAATHGAGDFLSDLGHPDFLFGGVVRERYRREYFFLQDPDGIWVEVVNDKRVLSKGAPLILTEL